LTIAHARIAELELCADFDPLHDIFNRRGFERELQRSLSDIKRYGTDATPIYIDLDGFKAVNDGHGHAAGGALLKAVAGKLTAYLGASDVVACLGGDEFSVLAWNVGAPQTCIYRKPHLARFEPKSSCIMATKNPGVFSRPVFA
jgi:diguanylate cyclase (GGDEF)-like protein